MTQTDEASAAPPHRESHNARASNNHEFVPNTELLDTLLVAIYRFWNHVRQAAAYIMTELGGYETFDSIVLWCVRNPHLAICLLAAGLVFLLPILVVFGFGIATILMTFTGILVLEGTLFTLISIMFFACLSGLVVIILLFSIIAIGAYFGLSHVYGSIERNRQTIIQYAEQHGIIRPTNLHGNSNSRRFGQPTQT